MAAARRAACSGVPADAAVLLLERVASAGVANPQDGDLIRISSLILHFVIDA